MNSPALPSLPAARLIFVLAAATAGVAGFAPAALAADQGAPRRVPHLVVVPVKLPPGSLRVHFRRPTPSLPLGHGHVDACTARCFTLAPSAAEYRLKSGFARRDFGLSLAESGPVSLKFNGRRLKMRVSF